MLHVGSLHVADGIPDAGQPVGDEGKGAHEQEEHGCSIFGVAVQLAGHADQAQQPGGLQEANEGGGLQGRGEKPQGQAEDKSGQRLVSSLAVLPLKDKNALLEHESPCPGGDI